MPICAAVVLVRIDPLLALGMSSVHPVVVRMDAVVVKKESPGGVGGEVLLLEALSWVLDSRPPSTVVAAIDGSASLPDRLNASTVWTDGSNTRTSSTMNIVSGGFITPASGCWE